MGWSRCHKLKGVGMKEFFAKELAGSTGKILDCATVGTDVYIAYQFPNGETTCLVILTKRHRDDYYNFSYKIMDESVGPCRYNCPKKILERLSNPPPNNYAKQWRNKCWENAKKKPTKRPKNGEIIRFTKPLKFKNQEILDTFEVVRWRGKTQFYQTHQDQDGKWNTNRHFVYAINGWTKLSYEIVGGDSP